LPEFDLRTEFPAQKPYINESIPVNIIRWIMLICVIPYYLLMQQNAKKKLIMQLLFYEIIKY